MTTRSWFTVGLLIAVGVLVEESLGLAPASRVAPLWVLVPTGVLLLVQLYVDLSPRVGEARPILQVSASGPSRRSPPPEPEAAGGAMPTRLPLEARRKRELRLVLWIAWLIGLIWLLGVLPATVLFLLPYLRLESRLGWLSSATLTALATSIVYVVFDVAAQVPFPPAALF